MGLLNRTVGIIACCTLLQVGPVTAQDRQVGVDEGEVVSPRNDRRMRRISDTLFISGLAFSVLEYGHQREVCVESACAMKRRRGYSWAAIASYAGAAAGYFWILGNRDNRLSIGMGGGGVSARVSW